MFHDEDSNELRLETLMNQVTYLVNKMKEEVRQAGWEGEGRCRDGWVSTVDCQYEISPNFCLFCIIYCISALILDYISLATI